MQMTVLCSRLMIDLYGSYDDMTCLFHHSVNGVRMIIVTQAIICEIRQPDLTFQHYKAQVGGYGGTGVTCNASGRYLRSQVAT